MIGLIVIEDHDEFGVDAIGVASNMQIAREMRDQYFGTRMKITKVIEIDVRDSGIEFIEYYTDSEGDEGHLVYKRFNLDEV